MFGVQWIKQFGLKASSYTVPGALRTVRRYQYCPLPAACKTLGSDESSESGAVSHQKYGKKLRLDDACLSLFPGHSKAKIQSWIALGKVLVNDKVVIKSGTPVSRTASIVVTAVEPKFVCRAGEKLEAALAHFAVNVEGKTVLDSGLSTGGFTDCLLQHGALCVVGVDVGYGQVAERVRTDPRVTIMERTNLRYLKLDNLPGGRPVDLVTLDLSFISVIKVLPAVCEVLAPQGELIVLIKPQFEVGKGKVGAGGVVRDPAMHAEVIETVTSAIQQAGFTCRGHMVSPIKGATSGNIEFLAYFVREPSQDICPSNESVF
eukprot:jgi/Botrbrau1/9626/Bobra.0131s0006.1